MNNDFELKVVLRAPDEMIAQIARGLLESEGIDVTLKSLQVPMYDGVMKMGEGYWGDVLVRADQAEQAKAIIDAYKSDSESTTDPDA